MHRAIQGQIHPHHLIHMELGRSIHYNKNVANPHTIYFGDGRKLPDVILENNFVNIVKLRVLSHVLVNSWTSLRKVKRRP